MISITLLVLLVAVALVDAGKKPDCTVCARVFDQLYDEMEDGDLKSLEKIEAKIHAYCERQQTGEGRRVCYSIETLKREASKPMSYEMPSERICQKLAKRDYEICRIAEGGGVTKTDISKLDDAKITKMRVKELKKILSEFEIKCEGCTEKHEFVDKVKNLVAEKQAKAEL
eukprot:TRINITY_DN2204_c0_g1_i1.p1 TRINITY_DN2204_c0_g1~~TRINITY_DN2204_c0_g1_i1.p1  ORF type:complete len:191 (+),score=57.55 TRINITY_DN2204_c0_g1_i1:63-575(+)